MSTEAGRGYSHHMDKNTWSGTNLLLFWSQKKPQNINHMKKEYPYSSGTLAMNKEMADRVLIISTLIAIICLPSNMPPFCGLLELTIYVLWEPVVYILCAYLLSLGLFSCWNWCLVECYLTITILLWNFSIFSSICLVMRIHILGNLT